MLISMTSEMRTIQVDLGVDEILRNRGYALNFNGYYWYIAPQKEHSFSCLKFYIKVTSH